MEKDYFLPAGDLDVLTLYTLTFEEFLDAFGKRELFNRIDLLGASPHEEYDELKKYYEIYCDIGGYPAVVKKYLETRNTRSCREELQWVIQTFIEESQRYFSDVLEMNLFEQVMPAIAQSMVKEKKGSDDLVTELSKIIFKEESSRITKKSINHVMAWLFRSHIIGFCGKAIDCNPITVSMNSRFYFLDVGVCRYFMDMAGASPMFGVYKEGDTYGGITEDKKIVTVPIYLVSRVNFEG